MTVVVEGDHIVAVTPASQSKPPARAQVIDAQGKFVIPGLWDMHTHSFLAPDLTRQLSMYLANGVTGVRDTGGMWKYLDPYLKARREGRTPEPLPAAPRIVSGGVIIDGFPSYDSFVQGMMLSVKNAQEAREAVDENKRHGADFIKVYSYLGRDAYYAAADEAKKQGLTFAGHVPYTISAAEASDAGQRSLEHADGILLASSTEEAQIRDQVLKGIPYSHSSDLEAFRLYFIVEYYRPMRSYSASKAAALFAKFVKNGTAVCPTLVTQRMLIQTDKDTAVNQLTERYEPASRRAEWRKITQGLAWTPQEDIQIQEMYRRLLTLVGDLHRAGVTLLAGTDTGVQYIVPGFALHEELGLMVASGLTPLEALQTATLLPARFLGRERELGTIEPGKLADLVLLDADPLIDIHNTTKINAVFANGTYLPQKTLQGLLANVAAATSRGE